MRTIKLMTKAEFNAQFPGKESECVPVRIDSIAVNCSCENEDEYLVTFSCSGGSYDYTVHILQEDYEILQRKLDCEYLCFITSSDSFIRLILDSLEVKPKVKDGTVHYVVTRGEYSGYNIVSVCSDRSVAERIAKRINSEEKCDDCRVEEYIDGELVYDEALSPYFVNFERGEVREDYTYYALRNGDLPYENRKEGTIWGMYVFARDEKHALKIASDKRAMLMAQKAGL